MAVIELNDVLLPSKEETDEEALSQYSKEKRIDYEKRMQKEGYKIVYPKENELLIDIDSDEDHQRFKMMIDTLQRDFAGTTYTVTISRNGLPGRHVIVDLPFKVNNMERIALQASLGSDCLREYLSFIRAKNLDEHPVLFVEKGE